MSKGPQKPGGGHFEKMTRQPRPPDAESSEGIEFDRWNWEKHDPEFYEMFKRYPDAQDPVKLNSVKWNRYSLAKKGGMARKPDYSPKNFAWMMRKEIGVFCVSIAMGCFFIPWYWSGLMKSVNNSRNDIKMTPNGQTAQQPQGSTGYPQQQYPQQQYPPMQHQQHFGAQQAPSQQQAFDWGPNKPQAHLAQSPYQTKEQFTQHQEPQQQFMFNSQTMRLPEVVVMNNNITGGYTDEYNDEDDQNQRIQFAMEIERSQDRETRRMQALKRAQGGGLDDGGEVPDFAKRRGSGYFGK